MTDQTREAVREECEAYVAMNGDQYRDEIAVATVEELVESGHGVFVDNEVRELIRDTLKTI